jgi:hypothetical protein
MKRLGVLAFALTACVTIPMALIRPTNTASDAGHNARDQTEVVVPKREPIILRPADATGPFHLPIYVIPGSERKERTARLPNGTTS